jgi:N-acetylglucosaminyldiphosphoundecaprenol N-acetyl-beta-D-mannosaminyltransferase
MSGVLDERPPEPDRLLIGSIHVDYATMDEAIERIIQLAKVRVGGYIYTPNVDHIVLAERDAYLREAYAGTALSLADGMPLVWLSRMVGRPLPEKVSGSDLVRPLLRRASMEGLRVYLLGAAPGVGDTAAKALLREFPSLRIVGVDSPPLGFEKVANLERIAKERMLRVDPDLILIALGCPKQEKLIYKWSLDGVRAVMIGVGATLDFLAGNAKRAPKWISSIGAEWLYRLARDPRRMVRRYLIQDSAFLKIAYRTLVTPREELVRRARRDTAR